ncbi:MAG: ribose-5-phosphate isomerase RpiA [Chloroflexi bacterium]|nr:MAG: ribose-5-phosphate isomerase RpiA [Chloroflexota bacterium]
MDPEVAKRAAADAAVALVEDGMSVGLGSGSTARWFIENLGARVRDGLDIRGVPTSQATASLAQAHGIPLMELGRDDLDLAVDGADAVDQDLRLIKGRGAAMLREKVVATAAWRFVVIVDDSKLCTRLGGRVPVELVTFGAPHTIALLESTGAQFIVRTGDGGAPMLTDNGNLIADGEYAPIDDPEGLAQRIEAIPGVVGHGLFLGMADLVVVGRADGSVQRLTPRRRNAG